MFIFKTGRWKLLRVMRTQVTWNSGQHKPKFKYEVTISNGAFTSYGCSRYLIIAWLEAHIRRRSVFILNKNVKRAPIAPSSDGA